MKPIITCIIPCYNAEKYLASALRSIIGQSFQDLECIVIDDGSNDRSREIVQNFQKSDSRIILISKPNKGLAHTRNYGISYANGEWIQFLDSDDLLKPDILREYIEIIKVLPRDKNFILYSNYEVLWEDNSGKIIKKKNVIVGEMKKDRLLQRMIEWNFLPDIPLHVNNTLIKKSIFGKIKFDETLRACQDMKFFIDALLLEDLSIIHVSSKGMTYRKHTDNLSHDSNRVIEAYLMYLNKVGENDKSLLKHCPAISLLLKKALNKNDDALIKKIFTSIKKHDIPIYFNVRHYRFNYRLPAQIIYSLGLLPFCHKFCNFIKRRFKLNNVKLISEQL